MDKIGRPLRSINVDGIPGLRLTEPVPQERRHAFSDEALAFVEALTRRFSPRVGALLEARRAAQARVDAGAAPDFAPETADIRNGDWQVADCPAPLNNRRVEITAPAERKKIIQALNSHANAYMADFEDSLTPNWNNVTDGQAALYDACRGKCELTDARGKHYALNPDHDCVLIVRPRGWHLTDKTVLVDDKRAPGALVDFGLFFFNNAKPLLERGRGPYFYLPKVEHWKEAELWNDAMNFAEEYVGLPLNTIKATLLIETLPAVFQMHEILHAMRGRLVGLNCGRWDYIFSYIKTFRAHADRILPERNLVTMTQPFLRAYALELIKTCHRRNAHAMGGMSAFIPIRNDEAANDKAFEQVRADKLRESEYGHDGTWVAHPGLIDLAAEAFAENMSGANQKSKTPSESVGAADLIAIPQGAISVAGFDNSIQVALRYIAAWLAGSGAVPIFNLMEDAATAEIARAQLWQWIKYGARFGDGAPIDLALFKERLQSNKAAIQTEWGDREPAAPHLETASQILNDLVTADAMPDFLTTSAYELV